MSQKYVIVHFIKNKEVIPEEFPMSKWPLHITLLANFGTNQIQQLEDDLLAYAQDAKPIEITTEGEDRFGPSKNVAVSLIRPDDAILNLHKALLYIATRLGAVFDEPAYNGDGYRPHATIQVSTRLQDAQVVTLGDFSLVDMFPDSDINRRRIIKTFSFSG